MWNYSKKNFTTDKENEIDPCKLKKSKNAQVLVKKVKSRKK